MTPDQLRAAARAALDHIKKTPRSRVFASRRGIVAGVVLRRKEYDVAFRRKDDAVRMELWPKKGPSTRNVTLFPLPRGLEREAAAMLDSL